MLKAGEYSPNNPLVRGERAPGDVLLALGEYERRRNTLRKIRQQQYREYLDQQAKKKQEAKEQAERERREREEKEREREEQRERDRLERERNNSPERRRTSITHNAGYTIKVDTGVQVDSLSRPLSVAVQTDETELFRLSPSPVKNQLTEAERELSPHTVVGGHDDRPIHPAPWAVKGSEKWAEDIKAHTERRRSYGDERSSTLPKKSNRDKLVSDLRHTYMPSIFDADAIQLRNLQVEKEAAARRQFYQQELKNQILEQQRIREERKAREKMLEQAEMRRLEEQLRMLRVAQEREITKQQDITVAMKDNTIDYEKKRTTLQKEIDLEHQALLRATSQPSRVLPKRQTKTSRSDTSYPSKLPFFYPRVQDRNNEICNQEKRQPYSINIPENSIFNPNYDVESYLRRNLNPTKESLLSNRLGKLNSGRKGDKDLLGEKGKDRIEDTSPKYTFEGYEDIDKDVVTQALVHDRPKERKNTETKYEPSFTRKNVKDIVDESLPIPVLRHSPKSQSSAEDKISVCVSDAMKVVENKWKVPAVQKNILKSLPNEEGKSMNILTQLGSIRRQLQLEQLKLDNMCKDGNV